MFAREISERDFRSPRERNDLRTPRSQKEETHEGHSHKSVEVWPDSVGAALLSGGASVGRRRRRDALYRTRRGRRADQDRHDLGQDRTDRRSRPNIWRRARMLALEQRGNMLLGRPGRDRLARRAQSAGRAAERRAPRRGAQGRRICSAARCPRLRSRSPPSPRNRKFPMSRRTPPPARSPARAATNTHSAFSRPSTCTRAFSRPIAPRWERSGTC